MPNRYIGNTFSPVMLGEEAEAEVHEIDINDVPPVQYLTSVVGHQITAKIISVLLSEEVRFNRVNVVLEAGDFMYCIIPKFRCDETREFTQKEVVDAGFRIFIVKVL